MKLNLTIEDGDTLEFFVSHPYNKNVRKVRIDYHNYPALRVVVYDEDNEEIDSNSLNLDHFED